jgi:hypothetical protein
MSFVVWLVITLPRAATFRDAGQGFCNNPRSLDTVRKHAAGPSGMNGDVNRCFIGKMPEGKER